MKYQSLFSGINKKISSVCHLLKCSEVRVKMNISPFEDGDNYSRKGFISLVYKSIL